jgi:hypothetical protein
VSVRGKKIVEAATRFALLHFDGKQDAGKRRSALDEARNVVDLFIIVVTSPSMVMAVFA